MFEQLAEGVYALVSNTFDSNITFLDCGERQVLVDTGTGVYAQNLERKLAKLGSSLAKITDVVLTHSHVDHIGGVVSINRVADPKIYLHECEATRINNGDMRLTLADMFGSGMPPMKIEGILHEGDIIDLDEMQLRVMSTPGHSCGSICLEIIDKDILLTGDTLFAGGSFGRVDFPTGDPASLVESLKRLSEMNFATAVPGHMGLIRGGTQRAALASYEMAKMMFR